MSLPGNGIFVVRGEMAMLITAIRRSTRWGSHNLPSDEHSHIMQSLNSLKKSLNEVEDLRLIEPAFYLNPFLEVIRNKDTTGTVTSIALSSIYKFLSYGLIDPTNPNVPSIVENIADAAVHARFVSTDHSSDAVVLMKILQVLRTLMMSPEGSMLTDESVCEIMVSCFQICIETRLSELLRKYAEQCLRDMTQLIFMRLPQFLVGESNGQLAELSLKTERSSSRIRQLQNMEDNQNSKRNDILPAADVKEDTFVNANDDFPEPPAENTIELPATVDVEKPPYMKHGRHSSMDLAANENSSINQLVEKCVISSEQEVIEGTPMQHPPEPDVVEPNDINSQNEIESGDHNAVCLPDAKDENMMEDYVDPRGIRFTHQSNVVALQPYGLACVRELLRFLISLCNPREKQNTPAMIEQGLSLISTALEVSADHLANYRELLLLIKDPLCRNMLTLLSSDVISIVALDLQVFFLLFEALRSHLKLQMEAFFKKLITIISADLTKSTFEVKEITHLALEIMAQMFRIPGLCTELYLNFDCDIYCNNLFEDLIKLLSKNVVSSNAYFMQNLSLDAILTIIDQLEKACMVKEPVKNELRHLENAGKSGHVVLELGLDDSSVTSDHVTMEISECIGTAKGRCKYSNDLPSNEDLEYIKNRKRWIAQGTELFNQKPEKGIEYLQEHGILEAPLVPMQVAMFLRENPGLEKKMIGEYICKRRGEDDPHSVLAAFADSFDYTNLRIDQALRIYLETFRLPGEAPLIFLVMEHFAERWHNCNGQPFANTDAAFRLAYAIIMLNMDQHNYNAKKLNIPMTVEDFVRNLRGCNGNGDFDQEMLEAVFNAIKNEEIVMPAEHTGIVKENYIWKVLLRRGMGPGGKYLSAPQGLYDVRLFALVWGPAVSALSSAFEKSPPPPLEDLDKPSPGDNATFKALQGLEQCATIISQRNLSQGDQNDISLDALILTLCKFTGLLSLPENSGYIAIGCALGGSSKAQAALKTVTSVTSRLASHKSWSHMLAAFTPLFTARLLPEQLTETEDYLSESGKVSLIRDNSHRQGDSGILSSLYSYIALGETRSFATKEERALLLLAKERVNKCNIAGLLTTDTKFLCNDSFLTLVESIIEVGKFPETEAAVPIQNYTDKEEIAIFYLELLAKVLVHNRDRVLLVWRAASEHFRAAINWIGDFTKEFEPSARANKMWLGARIVETLVRTSARLMRSDDAASSVLNDLKVLHTLPHAVFYALSERIAAGMYELIKTSAQNVHTESEWDIVLSLLESAGAGAWPNTSRASSPCVSSTSPASSPTSSPACSDDDANGTKGWIVVGDMQQQFSLAYPVNITRVAHSGAASRSCEALTLLVRDVAHVTPYNFARVVTTLRVFVETFILMGKKASPNKNMERNRKHKNRRSDSDDETEKNCDQYQTLSIQLLDLMHTLLIRTAQIFKWWRDEGEQVPGIKPHSPNDEEDLDLWEVAWMPLLQGIARLCTDRRKQVSKQALGYLQRALLTAGRGAQHGSGWTKTFQNVLLPLLHHPTPHTHSLARANTLVCKVFLHHLSALATQPEFDQIWLQMVGVERALIMRKSSIGGRGGNVANDHDDSLREAALESLKNMILVMHSVKIFNNTDDDYKELWHKTWQKVNEFLPNLKNELFPELAPQKLPPQLPKPAVMPPQALPTTVIPANPQDAGTPFSMVDNNSGGALKGQGYKSSMLLQPLSEMAPPTIGIAVPNQQIYQQPFPILYPSTQANLQTTVLNANMINPNVEAVSNASVPNNTKSYPYVKEPHNYTAPPSDIKQSYVEQPYFEAKPNYIVPPSMGEHVITTPQSESIINVQAEKSEIYAEYLSNPYLHEVDEKSDLSSKQKALSANVSPMHTADRVQYKSSGNLVEESGSVFNFSNYFGAGGNNIPASNDFLFGDSFMPTQEG